ncbi:MAG: DUF2281 domain-containing protein [Flavisolibacter sp.]
MSKQAIIDNTVNAIQRLPKDKAQEISDFADFLMKRYEENSLTHDIQALASSAKSFEFLDDEEELYTVADLKETYNGEG